MRLTSIIASLYRPKTLLLAAISVITGSALAYYTGKIDWLTLSLTMASALLLQIIANMANDLGDFIKGTDYKRLNNRKHILLNGILSNKQVETALFYHVIATAIIGTALILYALQDCKLIYYIIFFVCGLTAILAALFYTLSQKAYGYKGYGDISSFIFFGPVGVIGTYFLQTKTISFIPVLPALALGFLTIAVLNTNNIRDYENDKKNNKRTFVVKIGLRNARIYHVILFIAAHLSLLTFSIKYSKHSYAFLYIFVFFFQYFILKDCLKKNSDLNKCLGLIVISTFILMVFFCICINI